MKAVPRVSLRCAVVVLVMSLPALLVAQESALRLRNPNFVRRDPNPRAAPADWELGRGARVEETAYLADTYALTSVSGHLMARQRLDFPAVPGQRLEAYIEARGENGAQAGLVLLVQMAEGQPQPLRVLWDQPLAGHYTRHTGHLTLPAAARRIVGLELYRSNQQGMWQCREVSLSAAASWQEVKDGKTLYERACQPLGAPFASGDAMRWARPLHGGPLDLLVLLDIRYARLSVELAQRFEARVDTIIHNSYSGEWFAWEGASRINARLSGQDRPYDAIIVATNLTSEPLAQALVKSVAAGTGLVVAHPAADPAATRLLAEVLPAAGPLTDQEPALLRQVPWRFLPVPRDGGRLLESVGVGTHGQGRVVSLGYTGRPRGFMPYGLGLAEDSLELTRWWEYVYSLLGKCLLWAAQRPPLATLAQVSPQVDSGVTMVVRTPDRPFAGTVSLSWSLQDPDLAAETGRPVTVGAGQTATLMLPFPQGLRQRHGLHVATVFLRDSQGKVVDWATAPLEIKGHLVLDRRHPCGRDWFTAGQPLSGTVRVSNQGPAPAVVTVTSTLTDFHGRRLWAASQPLTVAAGASSPVGLPLSADRALTAYHRLRVTVSDARGPLDVREWPLILPDQFRRVLDDFQFGASANYYVGMHTDADFAAYLRSVGVTFSSEGGPFEIAPQINMPWHYMSLGGHLMHNGDPRSPTRANCFSDPDIVKRIVANATSVYPLVRRNGAVFHTLADEAELVKDGVIETCFCPRCAAGFRAWAQRVHGGLEVANATWGTAFGSWEEVGPVTAEEVRRRGNYAQWADFRAYMDDTLIALLQAVQAGVKAQDPEALVGYANPFGLNPFSGADHGKMARAETALAKYMRSDLMKEYLSLNPSAPAHTYYGYGGDPAWCGWYPWWFAFNGGDFLVWWDPFGSGHPVAGLFDCFGGQTERSRRTLASIPDLRHGVGKILHEYPPAPSPAAVLYSQTSMQVAWAESGMQMGEAPWGERGPFLWAETPPLHSYKLYYRSTENAKALLKELALQPEFVTPEDLTSDRLSRYRLLYLPYAGALSEEVLAHLTAFVERGGTVVGDLRTAAYGGHGQALPARPAFEKLFGVRRPATGFAPEVSHLTGIGALAAVPAGVAFDQPTGREPLELGSGQALARHGDGTPAVIVNVRGKGRAVYLNFVPGSGASSVAILRQVLQLAGVRSAVQITRGAAPAWGYECYQYQRGPVRYVGLLRDLCPQPAGERLGWHGHQFRHSTTPSEAVTLRLPEPREVYDVRAGRYLGRLAAVPLTMAPAAAKLLGLLPYRVTGLGLSGLQRRYGGGNRITYRVAVTSDRGQPGDHVLRVEVYGPEGRLRDHYSRHVLALGGRYAGSLPLALNDTTGTWRLRLTDVTTKTTCATTFEVAPVQGAKF